MQNPAFYGSWPLNLNQYAWSPEAIQQYQNMLLTDPTLQQQMHQSQTHQAQPLQPTPLATSPAATTTSIPPPPPPPPPPSLSPPPNPVTSSFPNPPPAYSPTTPHHTKQYHTAHQAQLPLRQRGSPTTNTTTAILYMGIHCFAKFNPPPGAEHAMFTVWILSFSQLPSCFGKAKRSLRWDCSARVVTWDSFPQGI